MKRKKLLELIEALGQTENGLKEFGKYIKNPAVTKSQRVIALFEYLRRHHQDKRAEPLDRKVIFAEVISPDIPYDDRKVRDIFSELTKKIEAFLVQEILQKKPYLMEKLLGEAYVELNLDKHFFKTTLGNLDNSLPNEEAEQHLLQFQLNDVMYYHPKSNLHQEKQYRQFLDGSLYHLDVFYAIKRLKSSCEVLLRKYGYGEEPTEVFEKNLKKYLEELPYRQVPLIQLFALGCEFWLNPSIEKYNLLKTTFFSCFDELKSEKAAVLNLLINGLSLLNYPGGRLNEHFKLYKFGVKHGLFIENGNMATIHFNNIVRTACQLREFEWTKEFVEHHVQYLSGTQDLPKNVKILYSCYMNFGMGEYNQVLDQLEDIEYEDYSYALQKYTLELKSIYELNKHHGLADIIDKTTSFNSYLQRRFNRKHISQENKMRNKNFIKLLKKIAACHYKNYSEETLTGMLLSFEGKVIETKWLKEKIAELFRVPKSKQTKDTLS